MTLNMSSKMKAGVISVAVTFAIMMSHIAYLSGALEGSEGVNQLYFRAACQNETDFRNVLHTIQIKGITLSQQQIELYADETIARCSDSMSNTATGIEITI